MSKGWTNSWDLDQSTFNKVVDKTRKKWKKVYIIFTNAGYSSSRALVEYMNKLIEYEGVPSCFLKTSLTQIWKRKGSTLDSNNMRFIHMRQWQSKLLEALITKIMKDDIINATPEIQLGGRPGASSVDHLVSLKHRWNRKNSLDQMKFSSIWHVQIFWQRKSLRLYVYTRQKCKHLP